ncbi:MAG: Hsp20/alpha crystallin family protein [Chloroflexi bacterium]|nr:Hsp20/alpha crystallin family protein [Chloroflexota bacterium]
MAMSRWEPLREMMTLRHTMDKLLEEAFIPTFFATRLAGRFVPINVYETADEIVVQTPVVGIKPEEIDISITGNSVIIQGERKVPEIEEESYLIHELPVGRFYREVTLPISVQAEKAQAVFENGLLTLHLPKIEAAKAKRIKVQAKQALPAGTRGGK